MKDKTILHLLADNPLLFDTVKELIEEQFETDARTDEAISDVQLGQIYRARLVGLQKVRDAFKEIASYRTMKDKPERVNRGR